MNDERLERGIREVLAMDAPDAASPELRDRVRRGFAGGVSGRARAPWLAAAAALLVVLGAVAIIAPQMGPPPLASASTGALISPGLSPTVLATPSATPEATIPALPEPITDPGVIRNGDLITATFGFVVNDEHRVLITSTGGRRWRDATPPGLEAFADQGVGVVGMSPWNLWVFVSDFSTEPRAAIWRSADAGQTWTHSTLTGEKPFGGLDVIDPDTAWVTIDNASDTSAVRLVWTHDGGHTWSEPITYRAPEGMRDAAVAFADEQLGFLSAADAGGRRSTFRSIDGGNTWSPLLLPESPPRIATDSFTIPMFLDARHAHVRVIGMTVIDGLPSLDRQVYVSDDRAETWSFAFELQMQGRYGLERLAEKTWIAVDGMERRLSTDGGRTWRTDLVSGLPNPAGSVGMDFGDATHAWATATDPCRSDFCPLILANWYRTDDGGLTWTPLGDCLFRCPSPRP